MFSYLVQTSLVFLLTFLIAHARKPPGYVAPHQEYDPNPPKYEYGYRIEEDKITHGKDEQRNGIYAQGRYYVENGTQSSQSVKYFADEWGYHPVVEYGHVGPHSKTSTNFVLGEEAIKLKNNQKSIPEDPNDPGKAANLANKADPIPTHQESYSKQPPPWLMIPNPLSKEPPNIDDSHSGINFEVNQQLQNRDFTIENRKQPTFYYIQPSSEKLQNVESLPQPQALVQNSGVPNSLVETAALRKRPNNAIIYHNNFGTRLSPKLQYKLVDSTKNLVSGADVLNINAALDQRIETSTLHDLLHQHITPTIVSSTTPISINPCPNLLSEPIVVADSALGPKTQKEELLVTPRPVSSKFLAPITAGVQLQHIEEQQSEDSKSIEIQKKAILEVEVQKTIPHYLGMYEYPLGYDGGENGTNVERKAVQNIELGKTLLYFPSGESDVQPSLKHQQVSLLPQRPARTLTNSGAYLLQIPGLFSKQKYSTLVQNYHASGLDHAFLKTPSTAGLLSYAPQNTQYFPTYHAKNQPQKLRKLNLLVLPRANIANLPPITRNPHDLHNAWYSNAKLNNGYLPPLAENDYKGRATSKNEQYVGLAPPKREPYEVKQRAARAYFDEKSIRMEYGFKPPLIPSIEIDEYGKPIEKGD
ncbi:uncharacterized protein [Euwallacea fornicatus]|uniref:uncharacterized protein n=1 Tax=Euwallacea fornicatus TaxID=995702 RepID=UPI00338DC0B5